MACVRAPSILLLLGAVTVFLRKECAAQDSVTLVSGNVTIGAMFAVNDLEQGVCGDFNIYSIQAIQAVKWFVGEVNQMDYVPGVTIGLDVFRTCNKPELAVGAALNLLKKYHVGEEGGSTEQTNQLFGILAPTHTSEAMEVSRFIGSLPANQQVFQISGSATGATLGDRNLYPNFFRVISPDNTQVQVMLELLQELDWNYVAIVYVDDDYGRTAATELRRLAEDRQICVPLFESIPVDTSTAFFIERVNSITEQLGSSENGLVRGMVILGGYYTTKNLINRLSKDVSYLQLILSEATAFKRSVLESATGIVQVIARGSLLTSPRYYGLSEFRLNWNRLWNDSAVFEEQAKQNPWLKGYYRLLPPGCEVEDKDCWYSTHDARADLLVETDDSTGNGLNMYVWYLLKSAATVTGLLKSVHATECTGKAGMCPAFVRAIKDRKTLQTTLEDKTISLHDLRDVSATFAGVSVKFDKHGDISTQPDGADYSVYNFRKQTGSGEFVFREVGTFANNTLSMKRTETIFYDSAGESLAWDQLTPAQCPGDHDCVKCQRDLTKDVAFVEGNFYVVALVSVYHKNPTDSLACGEIKDMSGANLVQSLIYAVDEVNKKTDRFQNVLLGRKVGLLVFNICNPLMVRQRLLDLYSGRLILPDGRNTSFIVPNIMGYVGATYSSNSIAASETLTSIGKPFVQISTTSTAQELSDRTKHPYFIRLVPPDSAQAQVLLDVVTSLEASCIQIIYDETTAYATGLFNGIVSLSGRYKVCVAQSIRTEPRQDWNQYKWIVDKLRDKSYAKLVVVIMHELEIQKTMEAILPKLQDDNFVFLGSDSWGRQPKLLSEGLKGSLVLSLELAFDKGFERSFTAMDPRNPWLRHFWEKRKSCYFDKSFSRKDKRDRCPDDVAANHTQDTRASFHINAVYAVVLGFNKSLSQTCGAAAITTCVDLTSERLVEAVRAVKLDLSGTGSPNSVFDGNGDGLGGFKVLQVVRDLSSTGHEQFVYKDVGTWSQGLLSIQRSNVILPGGSEFTSVCLHDEECHRCSDLPSPPQHVTTCPELSTREDEQGCDTQTPLLIGLAITVFFSIVLAVVVAVLVRRLCFSEAAEAKSSDTDRQPITDIVFENDGYSSYGSSTISLASNMQIPQYNMLGQRSPYVIPFPEPSEGTLV